MDGQNQEGTVQAAPEPHDLAEAFTYMRQNGQQAAEAPVAGAEEAPAEGVGAEASTASDGGTEPLATDLGGGSGDAVGGSADDLPEVDYNPARQQIINEIGQQAMQNTAKLFREQNVRMWDINDLYERDEQSGAATFRNPDDPRRPFSSRAEAQQFVDSMNMQVQRRFATEARKEQQRLLKERAPQMRLLDFAPTYQGLDQDVRDVLDDIVEPYGVANSNGDVIGFSCDLDAALAQARKIVSRYSSRAQQQEATQQAQAATPTGPALDMKTGTGSAPSDEEPKDLSEAMLMYRKQNKKGK